MGSINGSGRGVQLENVPCGLKGATRDLVSCGFFRTLVASALLSSMCFLKTETSVDGRLVWRRGKFPK